MSPPRTSKPEELEAKSGRRTRRIVIVAIVAAVVISSVGLTLNYVLTFPLTGPAEFSIGNQTRVQPGSVGCGASPGEVCYSIMMETNLENLRLSNLRFGVANPTNQGSVSPNNPKVPLGASAGVSVLTSGNTTVGRWNWSTEVWTDGFGWTLPVGTDATLILDSGLTDYAPLNGTIFWVSLSSPGTGSVGTYLR